jgi:hypothetical protein
MKYQVFQNRSTQKAISEGVKNSWEELLKYPGVQAQQDAMMSSGSEKFIPARDSKYWDHVCDIDAKDLEDVFHIGNMGPEFSIVRHAKMHSVSVGDIVVSPDNMAFMVAGFGFDPILFYPEAVKGSLAFAL